jgi:pimeloyl-ACP methyl ester carboxylesterase
MSAQLPTGSRPLDAVSLTEHGEGRTALVLHGGGGPATVASLAAHLAGSYRAVVPTHPGWNGTPRPEAFTGIDDIALTYLNWLHDGDLRDVLVVGSSIGGWIAAEMAVRDQDAGRITALVIVDGVGIEVPGEPITDFFALDARGVAEHCCHDAERYYFDPASMSQEQQATKAVDMSTLRVYAGDPYMHDPNLLGRLGRVRVRVPSLAIWGDSDRIVTPTYGRGYAAALSDCHLELIKDAGHLPHIEQPAATLAVLDSYLSRQGVC